jgi:hypothetical protein
VVPPLTTWPVVFYLYSKTGPQTHPLNLQQFVLEATTTNNLQAKRGNTGVLILYIYLIWFCHLLASVSCDEKPRMEGGIARKMRMGGIGKDTTTMKRALSPMSPLLSPTIKFDLPSSPILGRRNLVPSKTVRNYT